MKEHIVMALSEQFDRWEDLLESLSEEQLTTPQFDLNWSVKDVIAHLWARQQISVARLEAGKLHREPEYPKWMVESNAEWEDDADYTNGLTFEKHHDKPWSEVHKNWREGFLRLLELGNEITELNLLDTGANPWLKGYSLAFILVASHDHHQEHLDKLLPWVRESRK